jgi:non-ribosomal peptide synthetase component E (peptide arylation enzyme)
MIRKSVKRSSEKMMPKCAWLRDEIEEQPMRYKILAIAAIAAAISAPGATFAQTVGIVTDAPGITVEQRPAFREYVVRERIPAYTIPDRVVVGGVLPETGVTYYDVPQTFGATPYRYTVVNGSTVLVEPRTRRIVQIID